MILFINYDNIKIGGSKMNDNNNQFNQMGQNNVNPGYQQPQQLWHKDRARTEGTKVINNQWVNHK